MPWRHDRLQRPCSSLLLAQPIAALASREALVTTLLLAQPTAVPASREALEALQLLLRCGLTRSLWSMPQSLHRASADHDRLSHVGFPALCACLLVA